MGKKGRKFIDKKRDVLHTFKVVARSQRDPLAADETAPQGVLHSVNQEEGKKEREKYGIYFDDDYNYLQHLRGVREAVQWDEVDLEVYTIRNEDKKSNDMKGKKLVLPSSAFESYVEEPIGLLNKAAPVTGPRPELDPDVVAELDDDYFEGGACNPEESNALPDNFVLMLNAEAPVDEFGEDGEWEDCDEDEEIWGHGNAMEGMSPYSKFYTYRDKGQDEGYDADEEERDFSSDFNDSDEERDEVCSLEGPARTFRDEEIKSHFTSYSLTSSVLQRTELMSQLDGCFEEKFVREYQDEQVGALDGEDIDGYVDEDSLLFKQVLDQSHKQMKKEEDDGDTTRIVNWIRDMQEQGAFEKEEKHEVILSDGEKKEKWDCESILSTYSTLYNHPRTITDPPRRKKIAINPRTGIPVEHDAGGLTKKALAQHDTESGFTNAGQIDTETLITSMSAISVRPPGETAEERRFRKKALKELRRERRLEKKLNRSAFKDEKKRQEKIIMNNRNNTKISLI